MAPAPSDGDDDYQHPGLASSDDKTKSSAIPTALSTTSSPSMTSLAFPSGWNSFPVSTSTHADGNVVVSNNHFTYTIASVANTASANLASPTPSSTSALSETQRPFNPSATSADGSYISPSSGASFGRDGHRGPGPAIVAMGIIIPLVLVALSALACFFCIRRRRRESRAAEVAAVRGGPAAPEMKSVGVGGGLMDNPQSERAYLASPATAAAAALSTPSTSSPTSTRAPQPVILSTTMNNGFYTGIDTSDHISLTDQRSQASADTFGEEPPPPYRPRSVPPMSRESSVRQPGAGLNACPRSSRHDPLAGAGLMRRSDEVRSPFDDPESSDDDAISQISTIRSYRNRPGDALSVVSDVSYQEEEGLHSSGTHLAGHQPI